MKSLIFIFLLVHFLSFSQDDKLRIIDNFHIDLGYGLGSYSGVQYVPDPKGSPFISGYYEVEFNYISIPQFGLNYRNKYFKIGLDSRFIIGQRQEGYSKNPLKNQAFVETSAGVNAISLFSKNYSRKFYFGPIIGYSFKHARYSSLIVGGEFYYHIFHIRFSHYKFLEPLSNVSHNPSYNDKAWFLDVGICFSTKMFKKN